MYPSDPKLQSGDSPREPIVKSANMSRTGAEAVGVGAEYVDETTLDTVLAEVLSAPGVLLEQVAMRLSAKYPQYAGDIDDFLRMHTELDTLPRLKLGWEGDSSGSEFKTHVSRRSEFRVDSLRRCGLSTGDRLGDYELLDELDRGGMGVVYRAKHFKLDRVVALKIIRSGEYADELEVIRFLREAKAAGRLVHPGILPVYEVGQHGALVYYTMPLVDGCTLASMSQRRDIEVRESVQVVIQLAIAMQHAHERGVIHRDLKPSNVLVDSQLNPFIIDFGLAKLVQHGGEEVGERVMGTPAYMAPERLESSGITGGGSLVGQVGTTRFEDEIASDVYALGAILYFLLSKRAPFVGPSPIDVLMQVKHREPLAPSVWNRKVGFELDAICGVAMEKDPSDRYRSAQLFAQDLQLWLAGVPVVVSRKTWSIRFRQAWRKYPGLVSHVVAILAVTIIVAASHLLGLSQSNSALQFGILGVWLLACFPLQRLTYHPKNWWLFGSAWGILDVVSTTALIANAQEPRGLLLIAYPMLLAASALFYRIRMVIGMLVLCVAGSVFLPWYTQDPSLGRWDFQAIFGIGLVVLGIILMSMIGRVRSLFPSNLR